MSTIIILTPRTPTPPKTKIEKSSMAVELPDVMDESPIDTIRRALAQMEAET